MLYLFHKPRRKTDISQSASYSSTAGIGSLPVTSTSTYVPNAMSHAAVSAHRNSSPQSVSASTASTTYTPHLTSSSLSPHMKGSAGLEGSVGHGLSVSQRTPSGHSMTPWGPPAHQMQYPTSLSQNGRGSWDYAYLNTSTATGVSSASQPLQRLEMTTDMSQLPGDSPYHQYGERTTRV
jgi:hypothetical protein